VNKKELKKVIRSHCSEAGKAEFAQWVSSNQFDEDLENFISEDLENELSKNHQIDDAELDGMAKKILSMARENQTSPKLNHDKIASYESDRQNHSGTNALFKIAAALLLIMLFTFIAFRYTRNTTEENQIAQTITKENQRGRKSTIFLKDGSIVYLNSDSKIQFPEVFTDSNRIVQLEGEAFFDVARDENKPFVVLTNDLKVSVLGTSFNINAYRENEFTKISLNTGKVKIENEGIDDENNVKSIELNPGQSVAYLSKQSTFTEVYPFNSNLDLSWKDGKIVFENADLETMIKRFERWYNVDFVLKNKPYFAWDYTGEFHNQTLQDVLELLSFSQSFDFQINQDKVEVVFKPN
jgi:ferric-dicitrate binding protein FerR (iron transport regulator)